MTLGTKVGDWNSRDMVEVSAVFVNNLKFCFGSTQSLFRIARCRERVSALTLGQSRRGMWFEV